MVTKITESMETGQALQTLKWLDEERRKDKATIAKLEERLAEQQRLLTRQSAQIQQLESSLADVENVLSKVDEFEQMVSNYKKEMTYQLEQRDETWRKERAETKRLRQIEHEAIKEHLNRLEKELRVLPRYDEQMNARQAEEERLTERIQSLEVTVADLDKQLEEPTRAVSYLEERRRSDHRRLTEFEQEIPDLHRKIDNMAQKLPLLEQTLQKQQSRIERAIQETRKYEEPIEDLRVASFQREQKVQRYLDQGKEVAQELERLREQTHGFIERRQQVKRALSALEKFKTRIERRQDEMVEKQRIAEERVEREWEEWQSARTKELKKQALVFEQRWDEQERVDTEQQRRLEALEQAAGLYREQLRALWETHRADAESLLSAAQEVYGELIAPIDEQLTILRGE
jgi:chromosome segregation ATPase